MQKNVTAGDAYTTEPETRAAVVADCAVLRVYDRGSMPPKSSLSLARAVHGHTVLNWPIRSNFFHGAERTYSVPPILITAPRDAERV